MQAFGHIYSVMSSSNTGLEGVGSFLSPLELYIATDKLAWQTAVRYLAIKVKACADGGDDRKKGAIFPLAMILFKSLPNSKK